MSILKYYMNFLGITTLRELIDKPQKIIESDIKAYLVYLRNKKSYHYNTTVLYLSAIKKFYIVNTDYQINNDDSRLEKVGDSNNYNYIDHDDQEEYDDNRKF